MRATTYETTFSATCPVDGTIDHYELTVRVEGGFVEVELLLAAIAQATVEPDYQENVTFAIAERLPGTASVRTVGTHSGVKTTCVSS